MSSYQPIQASVSDLSSHFNFSQLCFYTTNPQYHTVVITNIFFLPRTQSFSTKTVPKSPSLPLLPPALPGQLWHLTARQHRSALTAYRQGLQVVAALRAVQARSVHTDHRAIKASNWRSWWSPSAICFAGGGGPKVKSCWKHS